MLTYEQSVTRVEQVHSMSLAKAKADEATKTPLGFKLLLCTLLTARNLPNASYDNSSWPQHSPNYCLNSENDNLAVVRLPRIIYSVSTNPILLEVGQKQYAAPE
jgi:hypothetical protein